MTERQIDEAIDGAVRDLMDVDADPAFRARVLSRLEHPRRVPWFRVAAVSAGAAGVILALLLTREREPGPPPSLARNAPGAVSSPVRPEPPPGGTPQRTPVVPPKSGPANRIGPRVSASLQRDPTHVVAPGALVATVADASGSDAIEPLAVIEPIGLTPIATVPIAVAEIVVAPLAPIAALEIAPFDPRRQRN